MPTGYTDAVGKGEVTEFEDYALQCARAFGALIMMRDDPSDAEIPEKFEASDYSRKALDQAEHDLEMFNQATDEMLATRQKSQFDQKTKSNEKRLSEIRETRRRYESMLEKAKAYKSPSPDHDEYAKFLVKQLESSIDWDCSEEHYQPPKVVPFAEWKQSEESEIRRKISYHEKALSEEIERTRGRNEWIAKLRESLSVSV